MVPHRLGRGLRILRQPFMAAARAHHVETDADVRPEWFDAVNVVGLTAGTSTPDDAIDRVEAQVRLFAGAASAAASADQSAGQARPRTN